MAPLFTYAVCGLASIYTVYAQDANITLFPAATGFEADNTAFLYSSPPLLLANDGSAPNGGFRTFAAGSSLSLTPQSHQKTGRSKFAVPVYDIGGRDVFITIAATDSIMRVFDAKTTTEITSARKKILGDWSTLCVWQSSKSGRSYLLLFGKRQVVQLLVRAAGGRGAEILEIQTFPVPIEGESCAVLRDGEVYFSADDRPLYSFQAAESTKAPTITTVSEDIQAAGLATYHSESGDYLFIAHDDVIDVYDDHFTARGTIGLKGIDDFSNGGGLSIYQNSGLGKGSGVIALAYEGGDATGVAVGSLDGVLEALGIEPNTNFNPHAKAHIPHGGAQNKLCSQNGFADAHGSCQCFSGFDGRKCGSTTCKNDCSGHGKCVGANTCKCQAGWDGPDCSFSAVHAKYETTANGGDGDDPAIWIHPTASEKSRIITTTKSEAGAGLAVFDLRGQLLQHLEAEEPNNVDIIYNFTVGNRKTDLAFAGCRDNSLCLFEVNSTGLLSPIAGGRQNTPPDYEVYGSCTYRSHTTGKQYLFVNSKKALYLQYELTSSSNGTLQTTLVRQFIGGSGGKVEGCVADDATGYLFLGEEPVGIWRYDAEPNGSTTGFQIAKVGDGKLFADVEGITLVPATEGQDGFIFVSSQGISAYLVYERAPPHKYVKTFTILDNKRGGVDHVSNTDGIAAVGNRLNADFPGGLFVTHDDANELARGGTDAEASFKLVSLADILGPHHIKQLGY